MPAGMWPPPPLNWPHSLRWTWALSPLRLDQAAALSHRVVAPRTNALGADVFGPAGRRPWSQTAAQALLTSTKDAFDRMASLDVAAVASLLREYAQRSALRGGNPYRSRAYLRAAESLAMMPVPLEQVIREERLREIPGVGAAIADIITKLHPVLEAMRKEVP